ncbi:MAG: hypothetical protein MJ211_13190 [Bacteroidales bacterium]|nr:hypothetical protein [Bacteroidales bacterium]
METLLKELLKDYSETIQEIEYLKQKIAVLEQKINIKNFESTQKPHETKVVKLLNIK